MLKLPRTSLSPEEITAVEAFFAADLRPVFEGSSAVISYLPFDMTTRKSFQAVMRTGCFSQGLESIAKVLDDEKKGLTEVQKKTGQPPANRMSRLLFISNDGSERFYKQVSSLLTSHGNRVWCCRVEANAEELGSLLTVASAKAIMINDKKALALYLTTLARDVKK